MQLRGLFFVINTVAVFLNSDIKQIQKNLNDVNIKILRKRL